MSNTLDLRASVAEALAVTSANILPTVCERYGLAEGDASDAMRSKRVYVRQRLEKLPSAKVLAVARLVAVDYPDYRLVETIAKLDEAGGPTLSEITRRAIIDILQNCDLFGRLNPVEFLRHVWPIASMPSVCGGESFEDDVRRHMINHHDWSEADLFEHLDLLGCSQKRLFQLLEAATHPRTCEEPDQHRLAEVLNERLHRDGFLLSVTSRISGYPVYTVIKTGCSVEPPVDRSIAQALKVYDRESILEEWSKARERRETDPRGAITSAKSLLEAVCKHLLEETGREAADDLPKLYHEAATALNLAPNQHTEKVFRSILGHCQAIVGDLAEIRNKLGDSHGTGRKPARPKARHAELAVNLAGAMATFLIATACERD